MITKKLLEKQKRLDECRAFVAKLVDAVPNLHLAANSEFSLAFYVPDVIEADDFSKNECQWVVRIEPGFIFSQDQNDPEITFSTKKNGLFDEGKTLEKILALELPREVKRLILFNLDLFK